MPEYLHPGVYIEETSFRSPPFEGVSTSTAGLVGRTRKGREGHPTLVTSFTEFVRQFGEPFPITSTAQLGDYLGHAVRAFFDNGGKRAYIVRTLSTTAKEAEVQIEQGTVLLLPPNTTVRGPTLTLPLNSLRNVMAGTTLKVFSRAPTGIGPGTFRFDLLVDSIDTSRNIVTLDTSTPINPGVTLASNSTYIEVDGVPPASGSVLGPTFTALSRGKDGEKIELQIRPADGIPVRLATQRYFRDRPVIHVFTNAAGDVGPTPGPTADKLSLSPDALAMLRIGDQLLIDAEPKTIQDIAPGKLTFGSPPGAPAAGAKLILISRGTGSNLATAPEQIVLATLTAAATAAGPNAIVLPHAALAALRADDVVQFDAGPLLTVTTVEPAASANNVTLDSAVATSHTTGTVKLADTSTVEPRRLFVGDTSGLATPFRTSTTTLEPIAVTDGGTTVPGKILLVDGNTVIVSTTPALAIDWRSFETLQVATTEPALRVASTAGFYSGAIVELDRGDGTKEYNSVAAVDPGARTVTLTSVLIGPDPIDVAVDPVDRKAFLRTLEIDVLVYENKVLKETFAGLSWNDDPNADSFRRYYVDRINDADNGSQLVSVVGVAGAALDPDGQPMTDDGFPQELQNGSDGGPLTDLDLIGSDHGPGQRRGIEALKERKDIALVAVPGVVDEAVQAALLTHCELQRYRFAILDGKRGESDVTQIQAHRNNYDSKYGGYYVPWLETLDLTTGATILTPPSGYVLGICARVDSERGVHKAPANETVRNILGVELPFTDGEQDVLNPVGVNLIREFEGRGVRVWGARTTTSDQEWKYVNVRRLFIFLEHSIDNGTQWVVFEPNNEALWERVKESIESFLFGVWKSGALMGTKPEEAYFVRCDRTTMTQDDIDNGRLVCLIGVAPAYPAEFVIFRIGQFTASTNRA